MMNAEPRVFIVDDDAAVRDALEELVDSADMAVESFASGPAFLERYRPDCPGCLIVDVYMPGMSGLELQEELVARRMSIPVIIITGHGDVPTAIRGLKTGAVDFIEKPFQDQEILEAIQTAIEKDAKQRRRHASRAENQRRLSDLSAREREVLDLVLAGCPNKAVAANLGVTQRTVEVHRARIMRKTQAQSLPELARLVERSHAHNENH